MMKKLRAYWLIQVMGWSTYACLHIVLLIISNNFAPEKAFEIFALAGYYLVSTHLFREYIRLNQWMKFNLNRLGGLVILSSFLLAVSNYCFQIIAYFLTGALDPMHDFDSLFIVVSVSSSMLFYFLWAVLYVLYHYLDQRNQTLKYLAASREFELNRLKSQMNPHFIFNALNSIRALVSEQPEDAKVAITQLSGLLRNSLAMDRKKLIPLRDELRTVSDYLALEKIRFEERLEYEFEIAPETLNRLVPPLMVQTLVENGIKHGIANLTHGGELLIKSQWLEEEDSVLLSIVNSGKLNQEKLKNAKGYGIANTRQRLKLLFGDSALFEIRPDGDQVLTLLSIPQKTENYESINNR
ncbi:MULTISPECIES: sensor histidine kinase [Persicobacter]|uniref:Histidine kinase n=1 Tax=Persicobacter diffluens TaxID=981 RepID=A0AAN4VZS0_9BACT|nr:histidine kinase [Persicobacter sp. CCB-QB2]GJM62224.1 histidine kinase [Persicobacter diffluens]